MNPTPLLHPEPSIAPPEQREVRSEGGPPPAHLNLNLNFNLNLKPRSRASRVSAFTLIELMVAAAITSLLILGMTGIFDQAMKAWRLSSRRADSEREIRGTLSQIQRDLSGMVVNSNMPIAYNLSRITDTQINVGSSVFQRQIGNHPPKSGPQGSDWSNASVVLFFTTAQRSSSTDPGDLAGVGYYVTWDPDSNQGKGAWNLYRRYQRPADFLQGLQAKLTNPAAGPYHINNLADPELIGANVFNFWAQLVTINTNAGGTASNMVSYTSLQTGTNVNVRPRYVQLELTAYGAEQVRNFSKTDWANPTNIAKFGRSYIWRVDL